MGSLCQLQRKAEEKTGLVTTSPVFSSLAP
jgi:hypothetical protein